MDINWIELSKNDPAYKDGVRKFVGLAKENLMDGKALCPCKLCRVDKWVPIDELEFHLRFNGFDKTYTNWIFHGKGDILPRMLGIHAGNHDEKFFDVQQQMIGGDDTQGLLNAAFGINGHQSYVSSEPNDDMQEGHDIRKVGQSSSGEPNEKFVWLVDKEEDVKYKKLLEASKEPLYEGCTSFSKLSFLLRLFQLKSMCHWSAESLSMLLELLADAFPHIAEFPSSYYEGKKIIKDLGLGYEKIDACPNNCILYWGENSTKEECHVCHASRWKTIKGKEGRSHENLHTKHGEAAKVMRYFPLIPRLRRIYMSPKTAEDMIWHQKDRVKDGMLRHPTDASAWRDLDKMYPDFSDDPRSVRLGLASDGFNPYRLINTTYSTWPVVLVPYNLPPWLCMKPSSFILSMIIPGKSGPGNDIDVYLQPLLHELQLLWKGVDAFDAYSGTHFNLQAALTCTINDFPAYAMLSGWSTKGYNACPVCTNETPSWKGKFAGKICYLGHRKWLPDNHPYRFQCDPFYGNEDYGHAPSPATSSDIIRQQEGVSYVYGKTKKPKPAKKSGKDKVGQLCLVMM